jgi:acyl-CoA thioesterase-2
MLSSRIMIASIDHAMWFHRSVRVDDWLLFATDSPSASGARGFTRGSVYSRDGRLVASASQEGLIRLRSGEPPGEPPGEPSGEPPAP